MTVPCSCVEVFDSQLQGGDNFIPAVSVLFLWRFEASILPQVAFCFRAVSVRACFFL